MEFAATFGSLGDIIAICQIAVQLSRALGLGTSQAADSAAEYQELRKDLNVFVGILVNVIATYEHYVSLSMTDLDRLVHEVVQDCHGLIKATLERLVPTYHSSLQPGGSGKRLVDVFKKVEWPLREKSRIEHLRVKLRDHGQRISMLMHAVSRISARTDNATLLERISEVRELVSKQRKQQNDFMKRLGCLEDAAHQRVSEIKSIEKSVQTQANSTGSILTMVNTAIEAFAEAGKLLNSVAEGVVHIRAVLSTPYFMQSLDPTRDMPILLDDALGRKIELPIDLFVDWESFNAILVCLFKNKKGYEMILRQRFAIEEHCTGKEIDRNSPLEASIRRGMRIDMSMVFASDGTTQGSCPRCRAITDTPENVTVQCQTEYCGMWFRVLFSEDHAMDKQRRPYHTTYPGKTPEEWPITMSISAEPSDFQRVRMLGMVLKEQKLYDIIAKFAAQWETFAKRIREEPPAAILKLNEQQFKTNMDKLIIDNGVIIAEISRKIGGFSGSVPNVVV